MNSSYSETLESTLAPKGVHRNQCCDSLHTLKNLRALNSAMAREVASFQGKEHFDLREYTMDLEKIAASCGQGNPACLDQFRKYHSQLVKRISELSARTAGAEESRALTEQWHRSHPGTRILYDVCLDIDGMKTAIPQIVLSSTGIYLIGHGRYTENAVLDPKGVLTAGKKRTNIAAISSYREQLLRDLLPGGKDLPITSMFCIVSDSGLTDRSGSAGAKNKVQIIRADGGPEQLNRLISGPERLNADELHQIMNVLRQENNVQKQRISAEDAAICDSLKSAFTELMSEIQKRKLEAERPVTWADRMRSFFRTAFAVL